MGAELMDEMKLEKYSEVALAKNDPQFPGVDVSPTASGVSYRYEVGPDWTVRATSDHGLGADAQVGGAAAFGLKTTGSAVAKMGDIQAPVGVGAGVDEAAQASSRAAGAALKFGGAAVQGIAGAAEFGSGMIRDDPMAKLFGALKIGAGITTVICPPAGAGVGLATFLMQQLYNIQSR